MNKEFFHKVEQQKKVFLNSQKKNQDEIIDRIMKDTLQFKKLCPKLQKNRFCNDIKCLYQHPNDLLICPKLISRDGTL